MNIVSKLLIKMTASLIGTDSAGNRYYEARRANRLGRHKRFVIYNGMVEASKVPSDWHGWLHHTESAPPPPQGYSKYDWEKDHAPNLTGTIHAYRPAGHLLGRNARKPATGDYQAWKP